MKKIFIILTLIMNIAIVNAGLYYDISMNYDNGKIEIKNINVIFSNEELADNFGDSQINIINSKNTILESYNFTIPNKIVYDIGNESGDIVSGGELVLKNVSFELIVPYNENGYKLEFIDNKKTIASEDVSYYAKTRESLDENERQQKNQQINEKNLEIEKIKESIEQIAKNPAIYIGILIIVVLVLGIILFNPFKKSKR